MPAERYSRLAVIFHWVIAAAIILNVALTFIWPNLPDAQVRPAIDLHKSTGILVLGLAIMRLLWRFTHTPPATPSSFQLWEKRLSGAAHVLLYAIIFAMPLTGWIMDSAWERAAENPMILFGVVEWPRIGFIMAMDPATKLAIHDGFGEAHEIIGKILYALFFLHVAGALKHQFVDRQPEMQRMWFGRRG
jgi:cytochrome b561